MESDGPGHVRRGHARAAHQDQRAGIRERFDAGARGDDVDLAVVGVAGLRVIRAGRRAIRGNQTARLAVVVADRANGDHFRKGRRQRPVAAALVVRRGIAGRDDDGHAGVDHGLNRLVEGHVVAHGISFETHVDDFDRAAVRRHPVQAADHVVEIAGAVVGKHAHRPDSGSGRDADHARAVVDRADRAGNVRGVIAGRGAAFVIGRQAIRVDPSDVEIAGARADRFVKHRHVDVDGLAGADVRDRILRVADPLNTGRRRLRGREDPQIGEDAGDVRIGRQGRGLDRRDGGGKAVENGIEDVIQTSEADRARDAEDARGADIACGRLHQHDHIARNGLDRLRLGVVGRVRHPQAAEQRREHRDGERQRQQTPNDAVMSWMHEQCAFDSGDRRRVKLVSAHASASEGLVPTVILRSIARVR